VNSDILTILGIFQALQRYIGSFVCTAHTPPIQGVNLDAGAPSWNPGLHRCNTQSRSTAVLGNLV